MKAELSSGSAAKVFETLKKKYCRKRLNLSKTMRSGTGTADVEENQKDLNEYAFFAWVEPFIRPRKTKTNMNEDGSKLIDNEENSFEDVEEYENNENSEQKIQEATTKPKEFDNKIVKKKRCKRSAMEEVEFETTKNFNEILKKKV